MGYKDIENREWPTKFRGRIYIHAGLTMDVNIPKLSITESCILERLNMLQRDEYQTTPKHRGSLIGEVDIVGCVTESKSPWFTGPYGFVLVNPTHYKVPIPCRGKLGFFEVEIHT
jgi:hypothetical protein